MSQRKELKRALQSGWIEEIIFTTSDSEYDLYKTFKDRFGKGEAACMAIGIIRQWLVYSDEKKVQREIERHLGSTFCLDTPSLLDEAVRLSLLTPSERDSLLPRLGK